MSTRFTPVFVCAILSLPASLISQSTIATQYSVAILGTLDNPGSSAVLRRVNSNGEAVGGYQSDKVKQNNAAFIVSAANGFDEITDQQTTDFSATYGINDSGEVAGIINGATAVQPFRAVRHTGFQLLPLLSKDTGGGAYGINDKGESVGFSSGASGTRAVWWTRKGEVTELNAVPGATTTKAVDINHNGDIAGYSGEGIRTAVVWPAKGTPIQLQGLSSYALSQAESISDKGDVVGFASDFTPSVPLRMHAVLWPAGSLVPQDLGVLPNGAASRARDVNKDGIVVGTSESSTGNHAFIWSASTGIQDLNALSADPTIVLVDALSINKHNVILAVGILKSDLPSGDPSTAEEHELPRQIVLLSPGK